MYVVGVIYNDIKVDNCFWSVDGEFKFADLGFGVWLKDVNKVMDGNMYLFIIFEGYGVNIGL